MNASSYTPRPSGTGVRGHTPLSQGPSSSMTVHGSRALRFAYVAPRLRAVLLLTSDGVHHSARGNTPNHVTLGRVPLEWLGPTYATDWTHSVPSRGCTCPRAAPSLRGVHNNLEITLGSEEASTTPPSYDAQYLEDIAEKQCDQMPRKEV
ncbi:hypothetical protein NDU88_006938 [Pleurodeles waltl]|uniref:Uncharacterized protein n=1 Tax=Pleurodeles waltl TaxID=8319 RepID=A0AAV7QLH1_PLEWA|nr:hypothetical protein NDU88_006938 [Pleurodeles waltl]